MKRLLAALLVCASLSGCINLGAIAEEREEAQTALGACVGKVIQQHFIIQLLTQKANESCA